MNFKMNKDEDTRRFGGGWGLKLGRNVIII